MVCVYYSQVVLGALRSALLFVRMLVFCVLRVLVLVTFLLFISGWITECPRSTFPSRGPRTALAYCFPRPLVATCPMPHPSAWSPRMLG
jgi:hypothetical protein